MIEHSSPVLHPLRGSFLSTHFFFFCYHCILALHCLPLLEILGSFHVYGVSGTHVSVTASELTGSSPPTLFHFIYRGAAMYLTNSTLPNMPLATFSFSFFFLLLFCILICHRRKRKNGIGFGAGAHVSLGFGKRGLFIWKRVRTGY